MIITCNECKSSFNVDDGLIKETGSKVRCSKCNGVFVVYPQPPDAEDELGTPLDDSAVESEDQLLSSDEDSGLAELDSSLDDLLGDVESLEPETPSAETVDELDLDLDIDQDADVGLVAEEDATADAELPDLGDLEDLIGMGDELETAEEFAADQEDQDLDLDTGAGASAETDEADLEMKGSDELDLNDFELEEEDIDALEMEPTADLKDLDFELDLDLDNKAESTAGKEEADLEMKTGDELDLDDFELEEEDIDALETEFASDSEDLELDLDLDLEADTVADSEVRSPEPEEAEADEIDFSEFEKILAPEEPAESETQEAAGAEDLDLDADLKASTAAGVAAAESSSKEDAADELDLSNLDEFIEPDEAAESMVSAENASEDLELDLDFQIDDGAETEDAGAFADGSDELDFSDLEKMLESDETPATEASAETETEDLDLQFDIEEQPAAGEDLTASGETAADDDFLDIEKMLEESDGTSLEQAPESADEDAELPLEMETAPDEVSAAAESELELDFDLEGELQEKKALVDSAKTGEELLASNLLASGDAHLHDEEELEGAEFQEEIQEIEAITDEFATEEFTDTRNLYGQTDVLTDAEDEPPPSLMQKPRSRKPLLVILVLIILALGVLIIPNSLGIKIPYLSDIKIPYLSDLDLKIPFLSNLLNPEEQDIAGNLKVIPIDKSINAKFIDNSNVGQLFVISGKIKNEYDHPRSFIKVTGKIYQKGKKLAKTSTVYCGNMISDSELAQMDIAAINKRLQNSFGDKKSNLKIKTGMEIPFMIVFDNLPQNLDEYSVEASGSSI